MRVERASRRAGAASSVAPRSRPGRGRTAAWASLVLGTVWCAVTGIWSTVVTLVIVVHLSYLVYVVLGGFLALRRTWLLWPHLAASTWGVVGAVWAFPCPLTQLEKWLRVQSGSEAYPGTFIGHYLDGSVWPDGQATDVWQLTALIVAASYVVALRHATTRSA